MTEFSALSVVDKEEDTTAELALVASRALTYCTLWLGKNNKPIEKITVEAKAILKGDGGESYAHAICRVDAK